ncbi:MAG: asparagine synthase-related protein [Acidobacteria bacterium]|nr:asparagine synthase-related protein [Acidobacteriota bacterium]
MSVQYGIWHFDGKPIDLKQVERVDATIARYGPDGSNSFSRGSLGMLYRAFHTSSESRIANQPYVSAQGNVMLWDGRLDNGRDLLKQLPASWRLGASDVAIAMTAYEWWGTGCFGKLIGDWALSVWDEREQFLLLAKDFAGSRHLHYCLRCDRVEWCTVFDPLVLLAERVFSVNEEFIVGYLSELPPTHVTPYQGIESVPASTFVKIQRGRATVHQHWHFNPSDRIRYRTDAEYEEHFRSVFAQSVKRRLRSDTPVLAELSGGMDSSSIVCMADAVIAQGEAETPRLDTISYYNNQEPNWDERPYFNKVEEKRGRQGWHIDVSESGLFLEPMHGPHFCPLPGASKSGLHFEQMRIAYMESAGSRVVLSGIGGDETLGGVPTPIPELGDLLVQGRLICFAHQIKAWSLNKKRPWMHLLFETVLDVLPRKISQIFKLDITAPWLDPRFSNFRRAAMCSSELRTHILGALPSFLCNMNTLAALRKQLAISIPSFVGPYDVTYPYLDRDLLEFVYSVPRDQILRPGQRRSMMRRALAGVLPKEILDRKRKAYVARAPLVRIASSWPRLQALSRRMVCSSLGFVDQERFSEALQRAKHGQADHLVLLINTLKLELWLQDLCVRGVLDAPASADER